MPVFIKQSMEKSQILDILNDWNFWEKDFDVGIIRENYLLKLKELTKLNEIVVVTGIRRSGKSTLLLQYCKQLIEEGVRKEDILIINFEDPRFRNLNLDTLNKIYEVYMTELNPSNRHYVVLDEVQVIDGWEKFARFLHENKKIGVFVTVSTSKLLSSEYSTVLAGRHVDMRVSPLSFSEFLLFNGLNIKSELDISTHRHKIKRLFNEYLEWGGFPKVVLTKSNIGKRELLSVYFKDIIIKDIAVRYKIKEIGKLEELAKYYLTNISTLQSFNKIKRILKLNLDTVERFSYYLSYTYLLFFNKKFSYSKKEQLLNPKKVYSVDNGLRNSVSFVFSKDIGRLAENMVFLKLAQEYKEIYYWKDEKQREVDFIIKDKSRIKVIQICWNMDEEETKQREIKSLLKALEKFRLKEGLVITEDLEGKEIINKNIIKYTPLWKWLISF